MKKILKITGILLMIFILFIVIEVVISYKCLTVKNYNIESDKIKENVKVVLMKVHLERIINVWPARSKNASRILFFLMEI